MASKKKTKGGARKTERAKKQEPAAKRAPAKVAKAAAAPPKKAPPKKAPPKKAPPKKAPPKKAPPVDEVEVAQRLLRELTAIVERASDPDAERILGGGALLGLLHAVLPQKRRPKDSVYQYLIGHKRRASLMAQVRHAINEGYSFPAEDGFVSPTRVQWFYDGLTFLFGQEPFGGVVGLYRNGELRWGLGVVDSAPGSSLGPAFSDFVTVAEAKKSLAAADGEPALGIGDMLGLAVREDEAPDAAVHDYVRLLERHPWMLGAQHVAVERRQHRDPNLPAVTAVRASDGSQDVVMLESPALPIVGKNGKILQAFSNVWHRAQRTLSFVQRQPDFLERELGMRFDQPRCFLVAGSGLGEAERDVVRRELEAFDASVRVLTYDDLHRLAERTLAFMEPRV